MVSAVEQLSKNANWGAFAKATELKKRIWFVIWALLVYRLGTYIPIPGIDPHVWDAIFKQKGGGLLDMFNMFSGGSLKRMTIFALSIMPYISASIIVQLSTSLSSKLEALKKEGEAGKHKLNQYTRFLTVILAAVQAYGLAVGLENLQGGQGSAVIDPGMFFRISTVITVVGGTVFLMWLGEQITARGIGNGTSLIIFSGIVAGLPHALVSLLELGREGQFSFLGLLMISAMVIGTIIMIVFFERAQRRVLVQYPKRQVGPQQMTQATQNHLPLKLNMSGVIPPIFASSLLFLPMTIVGFAGVDAGDGFLADLSRYMTAGHPIHMIAYASLIAFFAFFYTAVVFNPDENAEMLRKHGGFVPGVRPGKNTAEFLDSILTRITVLGAAYLCFICLMPEYLISHFGLPFYFGGTSLLIVVSVTMDTVAQINSHMLAHQYEGLIKKSRLGKGKK